MNCFVEIPFISASILDSTFKTGVPALRKVRQRLRRNLDPGIRVSIGRAGTVHLNTVAALDCVATAGRWHARDAEQLAAVYNRAGLAKLVQSRKYADALNLAKEALQQQVRTGGTPFSAANSAGLISQCMAGLTMTEPAVHSVAVTMNAILKKVDAQLHQMKRLSGYLVRYDGPDALVVVNTGERKELRTVSSSYLKALGLQERGAPFVLHELSWSPETTTSIFVPALDLEAGAGDRTELEKRLREAEEPLPEPPGLAAASPKTAQGSSAAPQ
jgi:hypothetical protein